MRFALLAGIAAAGAAAFALPVIATTEPGPLLVTVTTSPNPYAIEGSTSVSKSAGILGYGTAANDVALEGYATQAGGVGLEGFSNASSGTAGNGVFGYSNNGSGIYGVANSGEFPGVIGYSKSSGGVGVSGNGGQNGVLGMSANFGVVGITSSVDGAADNLAGVEGVDESTGTTEIGVYGFSPAGSGVQGYTTSGPQAILGTNGGAGSYGSGMNGVDDATTAVAPTVTNSYANYAGVAGSSTQNFGVFGVTTSTATGPEFSGVYGLDDSTSAQIGVRGYSFNGVGVEAISRADSQPVLYLDAQNGGDLMRGYSNFDEVVSVDSAGNLIAAGTVTSKGTPQSTVRDAQGARHIAYGAQQTVATIEDFGSGTMRDGAGHVALDPAFASTLEPGASYMVIVTPNGPSGGVYVTGKTAIGFDVRDNAGRATLGFDYRIVGRPRSERPMPRLAAFTGLRSASLPIPRFVHGRAARRPQTRGPIPATRTPYLPPMPTVIAPK